MNRNLIPPDDTTLFTCSGMQMVKPRFSNPDLSRYSSVQSCLRTNDLDLVGDGTHLTYFEMVGSFSFGNNDYHMSIDMWHSIVSELDISVTHVNVHPTQHEHGHLWSKLGYVVKHDEECTWSDGSIGGYCCELFVGDLEIGNLVNPLGHSIDVGFGLERMVQVLEGKSRVDDTTLFDTSQHPIVRDHVRSVQNLVDNGVFPGNKGRQSVCKSLIRRMLPYLNRHVPSGIQHFIEHEQEMVMKKRHQLERYRDVFHTKPWEYWHETYGLTRDEIETFLSGL